MRHGGIYMKKHVSVKKTYFGEFYLVEVIKAFTKTKENGENIYKMMHTWLRNCKGIIAFVKKEIKR